MASFRVIYYEDYTDEVNDPRERETAKTEGPLVRKLDGENTRVKSGDVVDGVTYRLAGAFATAIKRIPPVNIPLNVEADLQKILGKAYEFNFKTKNEYRQPMARLLKDHSWSELKGKLEQLIRRDKMRPMSALQTLLQSPEDEKPATVGTMSPEELKAMGLQ